MVTKRVYPDTPLPLHFRSYAEIDWCALVAADRVVLVLTSVGLREIEDHKDRSRGVKQSRARTFSSWVTKLATESAFEIRPGVIVEINAREPQLDVDFRAHGLVETVNDDRLIACMIRDRAAHEDVEHVCVTDDGLLRIKLSGHGIVAVAPPEEMRLKDEPDPRDKTIADLRSQLARSSAKPALRLTFGDGRPHAEVKIHVVDDLNEEWLEQTLQSRRDLLSLSARMTTVLFEPPSKRAVDAYIDRLRAWVPEYVKRERASGLTFRPSILLENTGDGNATDIDIDLMFPPEVRVAEERSLPTISEQPKPPEGRNRLNPAGMFYQPLIPRVRIPLPIPIGPIDLTPRTRLSFDRSNRHVVRVHVPAMKHHATVELPAFDAWFEDVDRVPSGGFQIAYRIHTASTPDIVNEKLHAKVTTIERGVRIPHSREHEVGEDEVDDETVKSILDDAADYDIE